MMKKKLIWLLPFPMVVASLILTEELKPHRVYDMEVQYRGLDETNHHFEVSLFNRSGTTIHLVDEPHRMTEVDVLKKKQGDSDYIQVENLSWEEPIVSNFVLEKNDMVNISTRLRENQLKPGVYRFDFKVHSEEGDVYIVYLPLEIK